MIINVNLLNKLRVVLILTRSISCEFGSFPTTRFFGIPYYPSFSWIQYFGRPTKFKFAALVSRQHTMTLRNKETACFTDSLIKFDRIQFLLHWIKEKFTSLWINEKRLNSIQTQNKIVQVSLLEISLSKTKCSFEVFLMKMYSVEFYRIRQITDAWIRINLNVFSVVYVSVVLC